MLQWLYDHTKGKTRIAFVGDSITYGAELENRKDEAFAYVIGDALSDNCITGNFGKSATSALSTAVAPYTQTEEYKKSLEFNPDIVHIMLGTNDIKNENWDEGKDNFLKDYLNIINNYKAKNPDVKVYVGVPPRIFRENVYGTRSPQILEEEGIPLIKQVAEKAGATLVDYFEPLKDSGDLFPDFLHPNAEGHKVMAAIAMNAIAIPEKTVEFKGILANADAKPTAYGTAPDRGTVDAWAIEATDFLNEQGIMKGDENGNINPFDNTTRQEAVLLAYRAYCHANRYGK